MLLKKINRRLMKKKSENSHCIYPIDFKALKKIHKYIHKYKHILFIIYLFRPIYLFIYNSPVNLL